MAAVMAEQPIALAAVVPRPAYKISTAGTFMTSGLGGVIGWIIVHPCNTVAVRLNLLSFSQDAGKPVPSLTKFTSHVVQNEGIGALYKGLSAGITRQLFYATSRFGLFEVMRDQLAKYRETDFWTRLVTGTAAGGAAALISCPAEVSLVRMANDNSLPVDKRRNYKGVVDAGVRIAKEEGFGAFWRGSQPFVMRAMLVGACQVATYDQFRDTYKSLGVTGQTSNVFAASMSAGLLYSLITMPFETAKNRMAFQRKDPATGKLPYTSTAQTVSSIAKSEGTMALWKGFLPYYARCGGHTVCMFIAVEKIRALMKKYYETH